MTLRPRLSFTVTILIAFTFVFLFVLAVSLYGFWRAGNQAAIETADAGLAQAAQTIAARTNALVDPVLVLLRATAGIGITAPLTDSETQLVLSILEAEPEVRAISIGWPDGSLIQVAWLSDVMPDLVPNVPDGTQFVIRSSAVRQGDAKWTFLAPNHVVLGTASLGLPGDPLDMQWYLQASSPGVHVSTLYTLELARRPGLSVSSMLSGGGVVSLDLTLASLSTFMRAQQMTPDTVAFLFNEFGLVMALPNGAQAIGLGSDGRTTWTTLQSSVDPLLRAIWDAYATNDLKEGGGTTLHVGGVALLAHLEPIPSLSNPQVLVAVAAPQGDFTAAVDRAVSTGTAYALGAFLAGFGLIAIVSWRVAHPLGVLTREAQAIRRLELDKPLILHSRITEVMRLAEAVALMKATLGSFAVYLPRDLVRRFLASGTIPRLGGERVPLSLMFTDVQGFTTIGEKLDPMELTRIASAYFEAVTRELLACGATIDKYIGDAVMAFWNAPSLDPDHAAHACLGALRTRAVTMTLAADFVARGWPPFPTRFGIHTGEAVVGNVGSSDRMTYTAMGPMVNLASRLEGLNKLYGTQILVSETTRAAAGPDFAFRPIDVVIPKGTENPVQIYALLGLVDQSAPEAIRARKEDLNMQRIWATCVEAYQAGDFATARNALAAYGPESDHVATVYASRLAECRSVTPRDWSPAVRLLEK